MKSLVVSVLTAAVLIGVFSVGSRGQEPSAQKPEAPWQVGHCYRVFPSDGNTLQLVEVLEPPRGNWVRVRSLPSSENVIGPQAKLWVNVTSPFAIQEWPCKG